MLPYPGLRRRAELIPKNENRLLGRRRVEIIGEGIGEQLVTDTAPVGIVREVDILCSLGDGL